MKKDPFPTDADIVKRLREIVAEPQKWCSTDADYVDDAADAIERLTAERDEARRLLKAVVDITLDNMAPDATHPKHQCDFVHRPDIAMCKVCKNWTEALATIYPDDFQDEEDGK